MIIGSAKGLNLSIDYILYDLSYANLVLYGASLPTYNKPTDNIGDNEKFNMDDPKQAQRALQALKI